MDQLALTLVTPPAPVPILALATTVHFSLAALRSHRQSSGRRVTWLVMASLGFAATPWYLPSVAGLVTGGLLHACWFALCNRLTTPGTAPASPLDDRPPAPAARQRAAKPNSSQTRPTAPEGFVATSVLAVVDETPSIRTFRLARPGGFTFKAGQFVAVRFRVDGRDHVRCYSISSPPEALGYLEISVKRQGLVSTALHASLRPGVSITVRAPAGAFTYPDADDRPLLLLAGGVGITPLMSMLRHAIAVDPGRPITLIYAAPCLTEMAFFDELRLLSHRHPQLRTWFALTRETAETGMYPGRIDASLLAVAAPDVASSIALICGPQSMIDATRRLLLDLGVPDSQVRSEYFEAAVAASSRLRAVRDGTASAPATSFTPTARADERSADLEVQFTRSRCRAAGSSSETILDLAEREGVAIPSMCRAGVCGTCRTRVVSGEVTCQSDLLDAGDRENGFVLACTASPAGDCAVEA